VLRILNQISETRIFKDFSRMSNKKILKYTKDLDYIITSIKNESERYQHHCYHIEDEIRTMEERMLAIRLDHMEESVRRTLRFANTMIQSYVKHSFKESLRELINSWEMYSCVLPLSYVDQEIVNHLPEFIYRQRKDSRKKFFMEEEHFEYQNCLEQYFEVESDQRKLIKLLDKKIISKLACFILKEIETKKRHNRFFRDGFKDYNKERIKPLFNIRYKIKPNINLKKKYGNAEERAQIRDKCRKRIENPESFGDSLIDERPESELQDLRAKTPEDFVNKNIFTHHS
jgi:hypothetical protein